MSAQPKLPNGLTIKQEGFCRDVVAGSNLSDAYRLNYNAVAMQDRTINSNAKKLYDLPRVQERIEELQEQQAWHARLSEEFVLGELVKNHHRAIERGELGNSNKTLELLGRNLNLWKEQPKLDEQVAKLFTWLAVDEPEPEALPEEVVGVSNVVVEDTEPEK
tara:strand:- start:2061 stop:2546 length:486 start_codon:yes stop_codon:yes gene_type:complete